MKTTVERIVDTIEADHMRYPSHIIGLVNRDKWAGFNPGYLRIISVTVSECLDPQLVKIAFVVEASLDKFQELLGDSPRWEADFSELFSVGREPTQKPIELEERQ